MIGLKENYKMSMKPLLENWKKFLKEELEHYTMEIQIKAEQNTQLYGSIFNKIRAIEGVTIIKSTSKMEKDRNNNKYLTLSIKFLANPAMTQTEFLYAFKQRIASLKDEEGDKILSVRVIKLPQTYK